MKILVVSDTHGYNTNLFEVLDSEKPIDLFIHCGDSGDLGDYIEEFTDCPVVFVRGNCDYCCPYADDEVVKLGSHSIFVTHGHRYGVKSGIEELAKEAKLREADIALYGHTHIPNVQELYGVYIMNPGSLALPRQESRKHTYGIITICSDGSAYMETKTM